MKSLLLTFLSLILLPGSFQAKGKDEVSVEFFARAVANPATVIVGDSTLVSYVLYSSAPLSSAKCPTTIKAKHARLRQLPVNRESTVSRVVENGKVYYAMVWAQYVVAPDGEDTVVMSAGEFEATFKFRQSSGHPLESFFGNRGPVIEVKAKAKSEPLKIEVKEKPRKSTRELMRQGVI